VHLEAAATASLDSANAFQVSPEALVTLRLLLCKLTWFKILRTLKLVWGMPLLTCSSVAGKTWVLVSPLRLNADGRSHTEQRRDVYLLHGTNKPMQPKHATNSEL
jgi:hypothetical protein